MAVKPGCFAIRRDQNLKSRDLEGIRGLAGRGPWRGRRVGFCLGHAARLPRFQLNNWVLWRKMGGPFLFMVHFHYFRGYINRGQM